MVSRFAALALLPALACSPSGGGQETASRSDSDTSAVLDTTPSSGAADLSGILSRLEMANTSEIQTSTLAAKQAKSAEVKRIAKMLVADHTENRSEVEALAESKGTDVLSRAGGNTARDTSGVLVLKGLKGSVFDTAFVRSQVEAHRANIEAIRGQMLPAAQQDQETTALLRKTLTAMEKHLAELEKARSQLPS